MRRAVLYPAPVRRREQEIDLLFLRQEEAKTLALRKGLVVKTRPMPKPKAKSRALAKRTWTGVLRDAIKGPVLALRQVTPAIPTFPTVPPGVHGRGYIAQHHIRYTDPTRWIMDDYGITPVVLVRNIFDALVSLRDHIKNDAIYMSMGYYNEDMRQWSDEKTADWLIDMVAPWYVNFFVSWQDCPNRLQLSFEQIRQDPKQCLLDVGNAAKLEISAADCEAALEKSKTKPTRLNKGVSGRGAAFTDKHRETVARYASYYPHVDFRDIGL